jgi:hypothetical protein
MLEETKKVKKNPLYKQIEDRWKEDEETELAKRKLHIQSLRNLHPLNHEELMEHAKKIDTIVKEKEELRKKKRLDEYASSYDYSKYQTRFLESVLE